ncbi:MAG TPA: hypothetical protein VGD46_11410 [Rhizobacter sp.]
MRHPAALPLAFWLALSLTACGGSSSGDDAGGGGSGGGGSGGEASVASVNKFSFPAGSPDIASMQATNDGVYLRMYDTGGNDIIVKRTARGSTTGRWMQWQLPVVAASFSASLTTSEGVDEFGIHWAGIAQGTGTRRYGTANMNNGGISLNYLDDRNIELIVPDGDSSTSALSWGLSGNYVYRESRSGTASTSFSARYERTATLSATGLGTWPAVADGTGNLYAASGSLLFRVGATGDASRWDFSSLGYGSIHTLVYKHNRLWIGYRDRVMTLPLGSNTVSSFATLNHAFVFTALQPQFCISGGTLYGSDGMAYDGLPSITTTPRSWLQGPGSVSPTTQMAITEITSAVQSGMFCAGSSTPTIYAAGLDLSAGGAMKLFAITPR